MASTHPERAVLQRFARGEATRTEARQVVAHLLRRRCESCAATVRQEAWLVIEDSHRLACPGAITSQQRKRPRRLQAIAAGCDRPAPTVDR